MNPVPPHILCVRKKNLAAVRTQSPALADRLESVTWPEDLQFVPALDQVPSAFSRRFSDSGWFGRTTAPGIREKILNDQFTPEMSNVLLPGVGQGLAIRLLLDRMEAFQSVFVWEPNTLFLAVFLSLYDVSADLAAGRLVLLNDDDLEKALTEGLSTRLAVAVPTKMLPWPWMTETALQEITLTVERAVGKISAMQQRETARLYNQLDRILESPDSPPSRALCLVSFTPQPQGHQLAENLARSAQKLGTEATVYLLDRPERATEIGLLDHWLKHPPRGVVSIGIPRGRFPVRLPAAVPFVSVLSLPGTKISDEVLAGISPAEDEKFILGDQEDMERFQTKVTVDRLLVMDMAVNPEGLIPVSADRKFQVIVIADKPETDPEKIGVRQQSHKHLWEQIKTLIEEQPLAYGHTRAGDLVERASRMTGVRISDPELLDSFLGLVRKYVGPGASAGTVVRSLIEAGIRVHVLGAGWDPEYSQPLPARSEPLIAALNEGELVMVLDGESNRRQIVFDALCAGRPVLVKRLPDDPIQAMPQVAKALHVLDPQTELVRQVKAVMNQRSKLEAQSLQTRKFLAENYSFDQWMPKILELLGRL